MKGKIVLNAEFKTPKEAQDAKETLLTEMNNNKRFSSSINLNKNHLEIIIEAEDMVALRATTNSYLRYLQVMEKINR